jgi:hypothetical protein
MKSFLYKSQFPKFQKFRNTHNLKSLYSFGKSKFANTNNDPHNIPNEPEFLQMVQMYFDGASKHIDIPKYYLNLIKSTKAAIKFNFPLVKDDGTIQVIQAYRAQHSLHYLPTKGGTRYADHIGIF